MNVDEKTLSRLETLAIEAGEAIRSLRRGLHAGVQGRLQPRDEADTAAETLIVAGLKALAPEIPAVAEKRFPAAIPQISAAVGSGWSIRSTAPMSSSTRTVNSPSILH